MLFLEWNIPVAIVEAVVSFNPGIKLTRLVPRPERDLSCFRKERDYQIRIGNQSSYEIRIVCNCVCVFFNFLDR